jgi:hypothetical protein
MTKTALFLSFFIATASSAADLSAISGLYYPAIDEGVLNWLCTEDTIGMDGGALAISETQFYGVEGVCDIMSPQMMETSVNATLVCMSEGMPWQTSVQITPTQKGVTIADEHGDIHWTRCG